MNPGNVPFCAGFPPNADDNALLSSIELAATELAATELVTIVLGAKNAAVVVGCPGAYVNIGGA